MTTLGTYHLEHRSQKGGKGYLPCASWSKGSSFVIVNEDARQEDPPG